MRAWSPASGPGRSDAARVALGVLEHRGGHGKSSRRDYVRLLHDSRGSLHELESDVEALRGSALIPRDVHDGINKRIQNTGRLLAALIRSLKPPP